MKTQIFFVIFAIFMAVTIGANAQTKQQLKAAQKIEREISQLRGQLASLNGQIARESIIPDSTMWHNERVRLDSLIAQGNASLPTMDAWNKQRTSVQRRLADMKVEASSQNQLVAGLTPKRDALSKRIQKLEADRNAIMDVSISEAIIQTLPQELTNKETRLRTNSNVVERQEIQIEAKQMALDKLQAAPIIANPVNGYFGKVFNKSRSTEYTFIIKGTETKSFVVGPQGSASWYLLPGEYTCQVYAWGSIPKGSYTFKVGVETVDYYGETLHWCSWQSTDVYKPRQ
jgi:hypothetical protein